MKEMRLFLSFLCPTEKKKKLVEQACRASGLTADSNTSTSLASANPALYATCIKEGIDMKTHGLEDLCVMLHREL